eukprot:c30590_g1_i1.p1 GENE.c30590_g1_i1~~c30590_g1_i1.p1  ORF type:complete len:914 (+),score=182.28 c30590_g1_i1:38-2779(+)
MNVDQDNQLQQHQQKPKYIITKEDLNKVIWQSDSEVMSCTNESCQANFSLWRRRHHCRYCGKIFCSKCLPNIILVENIYEKCCSACFLLIETISNQMEQEMNKSKTINFTSSYSSTKEKNLINEPKRKRTQSIQESQGETISAYDSSQFNLIGIKISIFYEIMKLEGFRDEMTTADVFQQIIKPITKNKKCSFVDYLSTLLTSRKNSQKNSQKNSSSPNFNSLSSFSIGKANKFVSHAWQSRFSDVVDCLENVDCKKNENDCSIFWFDMLCINHHEPQELTEEWCGTTFMSIIQAIGNTIVVISPWNSPSYFTRSWCLWELYCTIKSGSNFQIIMPSNQNDLFIKEIWHNFSSIVEKYCNIDLSTTNSHIENDKEIILRTAEEMIGYYHINQTLISEMKIWIASIGLKEIKKIETLENKNEEFYHNLNYATVLTHVGELYFQLERYDESERLFKKALKISENVLGPNHGDVSCCLNKLAALYSSQGKYEQAESLYTRSIEIKERCFGINHPNVAETLNSLGEIHRLQGRYDEAEHFCIKSLDIREKHLRKNHPLVTKPLNNLASLYRCRGDSKKAKYLLNRCLEIQEDCCEESNSLDVVKTLNNLSDLCRLEGDYGEAELFCTKSLEIQERICGRNSITLTRTLSNLSSIYTLQGRYDDAELLSRRQLEIEESYLEENDPELVNSLNSLAIICYHQEKYSEAEVLLKRVLEIRNKTLPANHPFTETTLESLARLDEAQHNEQTNQLNSFTWSENTQVMIYDSILDSKLNGLTGRIVNYDSISQKYIVELSADFTFVKIEPKNLVQLGIEVEFLGGSGNDEKNNELKYKRGIIIAFDPTSNEYFVQSGENTIIVGKDDILLPLKTLVRIEGLQKSPQFNGHFGRILSVNKESGRYLVQFDNNISAKIKIENVFL